MLGGTLFLKAGKKGSGKEKLRGVTQTALVAQLPQYVHAGGVPEFAQGVGFDLADPFARNPHDRSNLLEGEHSAGTSHGYPNASFAQALFGTSLELGYGNFVWILHRGAHTLNIAP